jgi:hypothetical protein
MRRLTALALAFVVGNASLAVAGETLLETASRVAREQTTLQTKPSNGAAWATTPRAADRTVLPRTVGRTPQEDVRLALQGPQGVPSLETSGMGKGKKWLIVAGVVGALAGIMLAIDGGVEDNTPSTLGTREDGL